ncbi:RNA chaperone Hfq [Symbiobacterium thermophilum]|uniref:RNA-binding protein Hfq n=1 Tax=Symbiobacterium thermophilum (strain DSM 24528 / JCM 14929 / IAM 14863 / T) TaxID=292459 RepID=HFQ_SYMTH|nr:RNA chaperone Hfq [Symbiobacterium thermophilum]Q67NL2.1 RecName: Full=RNA-binding protein Hfq [Symbiobacterium thermophilum IAM 14863]BAD40731.1 host factor-1 protein [Symbiobacterium thermophilum IAM 14863]
MTKASASLQDGFLNLLRRENIPATIYLVNGYQLKGYIRGFDNFTVAVEVDGRVQLVYKHALSTITPARPLPVSVSQIMRAGEGQEVEGEE